MKNSSFFILLCMAISALSFTACSNENGALQNVVIISQQYRDAKMYNGDVILLDYYCEFATEAEVVIKDVNNEEILQREKFSLKRGDGIMEFALNVGRYAGRGIVYIHYGNLKEESLLSEAERAITERFFIEILKVEDEPRPEEEIN